MNDCCSCRRLKFSSQHPHQVAHSPLLWSDSRIYIAFFWSPVLSFPHRHTHIYSKSPRMKQVYKGAEEETLLPRQVLEAELVVKVCNHKFTTSLGDSLSSSLGNWVNELQRWTGTVAHWQCGMWEALGLVPSAAETNFNQPTSQPTTSARMY